MDTIDGMRTFTAVVSEGSFSRAAERLGMSPQLVSKYVAGEVIGPFDYRVSHMGQVLLALGRSKLPALVEGGFDWVDVRDVADGAIRAAERAPAGARYLLSGNWVSVRDLAREAEGVTGVRAPRWLSPMGLARFGAPLVVLYGRLLGRRPFFTPAALEALRANRQVSHARATHELGYQPRPFSETLEDTYRWLQDAGYLDRLPSARTGGAA